MNKLKPMWGEALEEAYRKGHVITDPAAQALWRMEQVELYLGINQVSVVDRAWVSQWAWAIHCKKIEEDAFRS